MLDGEGVVDDRRELALGKHLFELGRLVDDLVRPFVDIPPGFDPFDMWTAQSLGKMPQQPYVSFLNKEGLRGARLGVLKEAWDFPPVEKDVVDLAKSTIALLGKSGAKVFDAISLGFDLKQYCVANSMPSRYERVHAINHYLAQERLLTGLSERFGDLRAGDHEALNHSEERPELAASAAAADRYGPGLDAAAIC